jgi:tetratricopeptide (TPR) repeat protein
MKIFSQNYFWIVFAIAVTVLSYFPVFHAGFTNWDDDYFITNNPLIQSFSLQNIQAWFTKPFMGLYQPLVLLSLAIDFSLAGLNPFVFHTTNLLLHIINTWLVYSFVKKLFDKDHIAIISMLLFGIHSIHVESVAWATERKDLLFSLFYLISLNLYLFYIKKRNPVNYLLLISFFLLSLFSKAMAVTLPLVLLLIDFHNGRKIFSQKVILEKIPFFVIAAFWGLATIYWHNQSGSLDNTTGFGLNERLFLAFKGLAFYVVKSIIPLNLAAFHPLPEKLTTLVWVEIWVYILAFAIFSIWLFMKRKQFKVLFFGYGFFLTSLFLFLIPPGVPVIASERYAYLPSIGIIIIIAYGFNYALIKFPKYKIASQILLSLYMVFLGITSFSQAKTWNNSLSLWNNVIDVHGEFYFPIQQRGIAHRVNKNYQAAIDDFNEAIIHKPNYYRTYEQRGFVFSLISDYQKAERDFRKAVELFPESYTAWSNLGFIYRQTNNFDMSLDCLNTAIRYNNNYVDAYINRAKTFMAIDEIAKACNDLLNAKTKFPTHQQLEDIKKLESEINCKTITKISFHSNTDCSAIKHIVDKKLAMTHYLKLETRDRILAETLNRKPPESLSTHFETSSYCRTLSVTQPETRNQKLRTKN